MWVRMLLSLFLYLRLPKSKVGMRENAWEGESGTEGCGLAWTCWLIFRSCKLTGNLPLRAKIKLGPAEIFADPGFQRPVHLDSSHIGHCMQCLHSPTSSSSWYVATSLFPNWKTPVSPPPHWAKSAKSSSIGTWYSSPTWKVSGV